jgi:hypothetical protein
MNDLKFSIDEWSLKNIKNNFIEKIKKILSVKNKNH